MSYFLKHLVNENIDHILTFKNFLPIYVFKFPWSFTFLLPSTSQYPLPLPSDTCPPSSPGFSFFSKHSIPFHATMALSVLCLLLEMPALHFSSETLLLFVFDPTQISPPLGSLPRLIHPCLMSELTVLRQWPHGLLLLSRL